MNISTFKVKQIYDLCGSVTSKFDVLADMSLQRYAILELMDIVFPFYSNVVKDTNDILFKHVESENGQPKFKAQLININAKEPAPKEFLYKSDKDKDEYDKGIAAYFTKMVDVPIKHYDAKDLLETKIKVNNQELFLLISILNNA